MRCQPAVALLLGGGVAREFGRRQFQRLLRDRLSERQVLFDDVFASGDDLARVKHAGQIFARLGRLRKSTGAPDHRASSEERTAP